jgi:hypothetical protein
MDGLTKKIFVVDFQLQFVDGFFSDFKSPPSLPKRTGNSNGRWPFFLGDFIGLLCGPISRQSSPHGPMDNDMQPILKA